MSVYLDNSATTRQYDQVTDLMIKYMRDCYGNPSSLHDMGLEAEKAIKNSRSQVAKALGCREDEIVFTSGGTESDNMALLCGAYSKKRSGKKIITSQIEHPAVLDTLDRLEREGFEIIKLPVNKLGVVEIDAFKKAMDKDVILISIMQVNNEIGSIQPIEEIAKNKGNALLHVDMVQGFGKLPLALNGVDMASVSSHKICGPKGVGALYIKKGTNIKALINGGGQETNLRSGTENVPGICGFGLACEITMKDRDKKNQHLYQLKETMEQIFESNLDNIVFNSTNEGAPHILSVSFKNTRGEVLLHTLEQDGIFVSTGSACSSNKNGLSHVIKALGASDKMVEGTLRFSFCDSNTVEEVKFAAEKTVEAVNSFRKLGSFR